jgi:L-fuculose-phosphate aldolase
VRSRDEVVAIECSRDEVIATAQRMSALGLVAGTFGNVSCRLGERVLITPAGMGYALMRPEDLVLLEPSGTVVEGTRPPSSEHRLHLAIYRRFPDARAIVHTHSRRAVAFAESATELAPVGPTKLRGAVPVAPHRPPGTQELADTAARLLFERGANAVILRGHGVVSVGRDLREALEICVDVERLAEGASGRTA